MKRTLGSLMAVLVLTSTAWAQPWITAPMNPYPSPPEYITGGLDTAVLAGEGPDYCMGMSLNDVVGTYGRNVEVWCTDDSVPGVVRQNQLPVRDFGTVAVDGEHWAASEFDVNGGTAWYGAIGGTPEQASAFPSPSLSLSHYSNGSPLLVHGGVAPKNHVYLTAKDGLTWTTTQLTNNFTSPDHRYKTIAARIFGDTLHITYWDESWSAVRYARKAPGQSWLFETVFTMSPAEFDLWPSLAVNTGGEPAIVFPMYDGTIRVFERSAAGSWTQETLVDPAGAAVVYRNVAVEMNSDQLFLLYLTYNAPSDTTEIRYRKKIAGAWSAPEQVSAATHRNMMYGLSMDFEEGPGTGTVPGPHIGFVLEPDFGIVFHGRRTSP